MEYTKLEKLPLTHGGFNLSDNIDLILKNGLVPQGTSNIRWIDSVVGKDKCVFLRLARARANYGAGELIIVNPEIANLPGVQFYTQELEGVFNYLRRYFSNYKNDLPKYIKDQDFILSLYNSVKKKVYSEFKYESIKTLEKKVYQELQQSYEFKQYLKFYSLSKRDFYKTFENICIKNNCTLKEFYERSPRALNWNLNEEICIPNIVEPKYFLGYWDKECYTEINKPKDQEMQELIDRFKFSLSNQE